MTATSTPALNTTATRARGAVLSPARAAAVLVALLLAMQVGLAVRAPLVVDEAHYALYGLHLDWSYFDHPPLVGWAQAAALLLSDGALALRLWALGGFASSCWLLFLLARRLFPDESPWIAFWSVTLWATAPSVHLTGVALVPESLLVPLALLAMHALVGILREGTTARWLALGAVLGLAGLAKYTAVTLALSVVLALIAAGRLGELRRPGPWLAAAVAAAIVAPVVLWNAAHDWISFRFQIEHGTGGETWSLTKFLAARAAELGVFGPALFLGGLAAAWGALRRERNVPGVRLVLVFALPVLALFWWASGRGQALPHWTQLAWLGLSILAARWFLAGGLSVGTARARRFLLVGGIALCTSALLAMQLVVVLGRAPLKRAALERAALSGWDEAAQAALSLRDDLAREPGAPPRIFVDHWTHAGRLAWYARPEPVQVIDDRTDQYDLWFGEPEPGARGVLVTWNAGLPTKDPGDLRRFEHHTLLRELPISVAGARAATFRFWGCDGYLP